MLTHITAILEARFCYKILHELTGLKKATFYLTSGYYNEPNRFLHIPQLKNGIATSSLSEKIPKGRNLESVLAIEDSNFLQELNIYGIIHQLDYVRILNELGERASYNGRQLKNNKKFKTLMRNAQAVRKEVRQQAFSKIVRNLENGKDKQSGKGDSDEQASQPKRD